MKKFNAGFILFMLLSCATAGDTTYYPVPMPERESACAKYKSIKWTQCVVKLYDVWEKRENAAPNMKVFDSKRVDQIIQESVTFCRADFCYPFKRSRYQPTFWRTFLTYSGLIGAGVIAGAAAVSTGNAAPLVEYLHYVARIAPFL